MQQQLWHDSVFDALGSAVQAAGGTKKIAGKLWPALDSDVAAARLRSSINPDHAQKLCPSEIVLILKLAADAGDYSIAHFIAREAGGEFKPMSPADAKKRAKKQRASVLMAELAGLMTED